MKFHVLSIVFFLFISCSSIQKKTSIIKIDIKKEKTNLKLPEISIESIISIKSDSSSYFGNIDKIKYIKDNIYIYDSRSSRSVLVFSKNGDFINKTKYGEGPGEISFPSAFFANTDFIYVSEITGFINKYDLTLSFLSRERIDDIIPFTNFAIFDNQMLVSSHFKQDFVFTLYPDISISGANKSISFVPDFKYNASQGVGENISINNRILLIAPFDYNVYELIGKDVNKAYHFDFGTYEIQKDDVERGGISGTWNSINLGEKVSSLNDITQSTDFLSFRVYYKKEPITYMYSLKNENIYRFNEYFNRGLIPKCKIRGVIKENVFYATVEAEHMIEFQEKTGQKLVDHEIQQDENPFVITFSLTEN